MANKSIVVTIGSYLSIVSNHKNNNYESEFLQELNEENKEKLKKIFQKNKSSPIYIVLDTIDQSYKKKTYTTIKRKDLEAIIRRDLNAEGGKDDLKNYIIIEKVKQKQEKNKLQSFLESLIPKKSKTECIFVSTALSDSVNKWLEFLYEMPNRLIGIYLLPIESFNLFKLIESEVKKQENKTLKHSKNHVYCLILQTKAGGTRQIVISDHGILFTRVVNYNYDEPEFVEKYFQDIYSTFEYLKRIYIDLTIKDFEVVNLMPQRILNPLKGVANTELNSINLDIENISQSLKFKENYSEYKEYCDHIVIDIFNKSKKILQFSNIKIKTSEKIFSIINASFVYNIIALTIIGISLIYTLFSLEGVRDTLSKSESEKKETSDQLERLSKLMLEGAQVNEGDAKISIETINDFGKIEEVLSSSEPKFIDYYSKLNFISGYNVKLNKFTYNLKNFNHKSPDNNSSHEILINGILLNKSGDIEDLFTEFDNFVSEVKKNMAGNEIKYNELPKNIDFNKKYYDFPIDFTISSSKNN